MSRTGLVPLNIYRAAADPTTPTPKAGDVYYNTTSNVLRYYNGSAWADLGGSGSATYLATLSASAPASPVSGQVWLDTTAPGVDPMTYALSRRNALHNGSMRVSQRGTTAAASTGTGSGRSGPDRWAVYRTSSFTAGCTWTNASSGGPTDIPCYTRVQRDSGNTSTVACVIGQAIESDDSSRFRGKPATLSFYARAGANFSAASSILTATISSGTGADEVVTATFTGEAVEVTQGVTLTTSWQRFVIQDPAMAAGLTQVKVTFSFTPVGTAGANDYFDITGVQLEEGLAVTAYERKPIGEELATCLRYYWRHTGATSDRFGSGVVSAGTSAVVFVQYPIPMRANPTYASSAAGVLSVTTGTTFAGSANTSSTKNETGAQIGITITGGTSGQGCLGFFNAAGWIEFSAEL